jgi:hypothetical protein
MSAMVQIHAIVLASLSVLVMVRMVVVRVMCRLARGGGSVHGVAPPAGVGGMVPRVLVQDAPVGVVLVPSRGVCGGRLLGHSAQ